MGDARKVSDLSEWYAAQYVKSVAPFAVEGGERFKTFFKAFPTPSDNPKHPYPISGRIRMMSFLSLKLQYPLGPKGYSCLAMVAKMGEARAHFAYAYWRRGSENGPPEYVCVSPTFESRDGEYRARFICGPAFFAACESFATDLAPFEEAVISLITNDLEIETVAYPEDSSDEVVAQASNSRLPILAFAVTLALDLWEYQTGMLMVHTSKNYTKLLKAIATQYPNLLDLSKDTALRRKLAAFESGSIKGGNRVKCGQKLVPMYTREAMQSFDYNLAAWRELSVTQLVGDLVINYISPGFAIYNQWTYVEGADVSLFENSAMEERYVRGQAVENAAGPLRESRRMIDSLTTEQNYYTEELSAHLYESLEYAQSYLLMSPVALAHTIEDVGKSLRSVPAWVRLSHVQWPTIVRSFADPDVAARHIFELAYGAHCLHTKLGVAHTDLHGNNMTLYRWGIPGFLNADEGKYSPFYTDPVVAYIAGPRGEADTFVFPATGDSACIIDYSRAILGPAFQSRLEKGQSPQYAINFYRDQVNRVMRAFHHYAPKEYVRKHQNAIKAAVLANFEAVFPILCAVDFIAIGANLGAIFSESAIPDEKELRQFSISKEAVELARELEKMGRELLITGLHDLAESAGARKEMKIPKFPGAAVLERVFGKWRFPKWASSDPRRLRSAQLVDAYNYNNEIQYEGMDYAHYPPWARFDEIERHLGQYKLTDLFERGVEPFLEALQPSARAEVIADQIRTQQEKMDGKPVSTGSSWLED